MLHVFYRKKKKKAKTLVSKASTVLQQYENSQMSKLDLEKAEELEIKWPTSVGS